MRRPRILARQRHLSMPGESVSPLPAREWINLLAERGSFRELSAALVADPLMFVEYEPYATSLARARSKTGEAESVLVGDARVGNHEIVIAAFEFRFLGGSLGVAAGQMLVRGCARAVERKVPLVLVISSSGARIQEGLPALLQMSRTAAAVAELREVGIPVLTVLGHPATGAPVASCANLADFVLAEQGALIGFVGPRVAAAVNGGPPMGRTAEQLYSRGIIDLAAPRSELAGRLHAILDILAPDEGDPKLKEHLEPPSASPELLDGWELLERLRESRPRIGTWLERLLDSSFEFTGDRSGEDDRALRCLVGRLGGQRLLVIAQDRRVGPVRAAGYRKAIRAVRIAERLRLPILSLIDGPGAAVGVAADDTGIAYWIAECFGALLQAPVPIVSVIIGEGSSGGALALAIADRTFMLSDATFSVIAPEGAAAIRGRGRTAADWANLLRIRAIDISQLGLVDAVLPVPRGRFRRRHAFSSVRRFVSASLVELSERPRSAHARTRRERYLNLTNHLVRESAIEPSHLSVGG